MSQKYKKTPKYIKFTQFYTKVHIKNTQNHAILHNITQYYTKQ